MCGRYLLYSSTDVLARAFGLDPTDRPNLAPRYNIAPTQDVPIVRLGEGRRRLDRARWGLVPSWAKDLAIGTKMINARSETAHEKPAFRQAFRARRCLVPADGFFEWTSENKVKQPWLLEPAAGGPIAFAGLFEHWRSPEGESVQSCTILTTDASADIQHLHHRMPVILAEASFDRWLEATVDEARPLLCPAPVGTLRARQVDRRVNAVKYDDPSLIEPAPVQASLL
ncbi:MAG: SOS response-associated peptidase [Geminicoccaceae bacterium]|nr:MAG: SOS response-associated peptidase [Geminicoccaceae bacterium]